MGGRSPRLHAFSPCRGSGSWRAVYHREGWQALGQGNCAGRSGGRADTTPRIYGGSIHCPGQFRPDGRRPDRATIWCEPVKLLLDTHLLLWAAGEPDRLSSDASRFIENLEHELFFSAASLREFAIKRGLGRDDFRVDPRLLRRGLMDNGYSELVIDSARGSGRRSTAASQGSLRPYPRRSGVD
jgi:hypothetical protein